MFEFSKKYLGALASIATAGWPNNYTSNEQLLAALLVAKLKRKEAQQIVNLSKPCVWLETASVEDEKQIAIGANKIGGRPDLPESHEWPQRPAYPDAAERSAEHVIESERLNEWWSWATPEQCDEFRRDYKQMAQVIKQPFPLQFIAQINLAEIWAAGTLEGDLPSSGLLSIFYDVAGDPWGFKPEDRAGFQILFHEQNSEELTRRDVPHELTSLERYRPFTPLSCKPHEAIAPVPREAQAYQKLGLSTKMDDLFHEWRFDDENCVLASEDGEKSSCHRVEGWPTPVQNGMETECALVTAGHDTGDGKAYTDPDTVSIRETATDWQLLLQIGSDEKAGIMWGDSGQLYVWIRREDLRDSDFSKAHVILQCY